jgi:nitroimidazol reductase NimA-like FMN-containing flavoprotein (pyridoxamine 5'-phosphate oxidase superfamily)
MGWLLIEKTMSSDEKVREALVELLGSQRFAALATQSDGQPYQSLMAFVASGDLRRLFFLSERETRKFANMVANAQTTVLVDNRSNDSTDLIGATAVTAEGSAAELEGQARGGAVDLFLRKHPSLAGFAE